MVVLVFGGGTGVPVGFLVLPEQMVLMLLVVVVFLVEVVAFVCMGVVVRCHVLVALMVCQCGVVLLQVVLELGHLGWCANAPMMCRQNMSRLEMKISTA